MTIGLDHTCAPAVTRSRSAPCSVRAIPPDRDHCFMLLVALGLAACAPASAGAPAVASPTGIRKAPAPHPPGSASPAAESRCAATSSSPAGLPSWMLGHWVQPDGTGSETWLPAGPALLGVGFATTRDGTSWFEVLSITDVNGALTYTAIPDGRQSTDFPLVDADVTSVSFANPAHEHPQRIRYQGHGETLLAEIESERRGNQRWAWRRAAISPAALLEEADRRFAADSDVRGADAWAAAFASDGAVWRRGHPPIVGPEAIRERMQRVFSNAVLVWEPHTSVWSPAGDMGFTIGCYESRPRGAAPSPARAEIGTYLTIWRRQADGSWRAVFDTGIAHGSL